MTYDWKSYRRQLVERIGDIAKLSPGTIHGYRELTEAGEKSGLLSPKTRELIALAVAVTRQNDGCIAVHTEAAIRHGARREEIAEALGVAIAVNTNVTLVASSRVMDAMAAHAAA